MTNKSSQSHLGRVRRYPHVGECTLPLRVSAVACTMRNEALRIITGRYRSVTGHYGMLWKHCASLWNVMEAFWKRHGVLLSITEHYGVLRDVMERCWSIMELLRNVT